MQKIMFNDNYGLTNAVLQGRKTMTRRIVKDVNLLQWLHEMEVAEYAIEGTLFEEYSPYKVGEVVAIAQSYKDAGLEPNDCVGSISYGGNIYGPMLAGDVPGWNNKMFVKADLMPHRIRITDIKVERLQDISDEDCLREGVLKKSSFPRKKSFPYYFSGGKHEWDNSFSTPREAFAALIDKVSGRGTWDNNPWVFAYSYELVK